MLGAVLRGVRGGVISCVDLKNDWCMITDSTNITDNDNNIVIDNGDRVQKVTFFTWRSINKVKTIPQTIFETFPQLEILDIIIGVENISPKDFELASSLNILILMKNKLRNIPTGAFIKASALTAIQLDGNSIEQIDDNAFKDLNSLYMITLGYNKLTSINRFTFAGAKNLDNIDLKNNDIRTIEVGAFDLPKLQTLVLRGNYISTLPSRLFEQTPLSTSLDLADNNFSVLPDAFFGNNTISFLDLSWNPLDEVKIEDFIKLPKLTVLRLQQVGMIWPIATPNWSEPSSSPLTFISLAFTNINNSDVLKYVSPFASLKTFLLSGTAITTINDITDIKQRFTNFTDLSVDSAEMNCDWVKSTAEHFKSNEVELFTGDDADDFNVRKRERVDDQPCGKYFND